MPAFQKRIRNSSICRSRSIPEYHYEAINVENQQKNLSSLLWWMRRVIAMRKNFKAFSRGSLEFLFPENAKVLAFLRRFENETILVVVNLSRYSQAAEIDLSRFSGCAPMEVFSQNVFPPVRKSPYVITLGPHAHYWFVLKAPSSAKRVSHKRIVPEIAAPARLPTLLANGQRARLEREILPAFIQSCRWFGAKARTISAMRVLEEVPLSDDENAARFWFVEVTYTDGSPETYALPVQIATGEAARSILRAASHAVIARFSGSNETILHDAVWDAGFREKLFRLMSNGQRLSGKNGELVGLASRSLEQAKGMVPMSQVLNAEQSNSSMLFEKSFFLKLYRKLEDGMNPDVEVTRFLTERRNFPHVPAFGGAIEFRRLKCEPTVVCLLQSAAPNEGDAWAFALDSVGRYYERVLARKGDLQSAGVAAGPLLDQLIGGVYPEKAQLLGLRTGELHQALASSRTIARLRRNRSTRWHSVPFTSRCALRFAAHLPCSRRNCRRCRKSFATRPRKFWRGRSNPQTGAAHSRATVRREQNPCAWRLPSRPGALHRKRFCHPRF